MWQTDPLLQHPEQEGPELSQHHKTPHVPVGKPKVGRPRSKSAHASKVTDSSKKSRGKKLLVGLQNRLK